MTYNVFGGTLSLTQSINLFSSVLSCYRPVSPRPYTYCPVPSFPILCSPVQTSSNPSHPLPFFPFVLPRYPVQSNLGSFFPTFPFLSSSSDLACSAIQSSYVQYRLVALPSSAFLSSFVQSCLVRSRPVQPCSPILSSPLKSCPLLSTPFQSCPVPSNIVQYCPIPSSPARHVQCCLVLPRLVQSRSVPFCPVLFRTVLLRPIWTSRICNTKNTMQHNITQFL